jgi:hypothetical protein
MGSLINQYNRDEYIKRHTLWKALIGGKENKDWIIADLLTIVEFLTERVTKLEEKNNDLAKDSRRNDSTECKGSEM